MPSPLNVNGWEIVVLAILFLVLFGPEKLPEIAIQVGKLVRELRQMADVATEELTREIKAAADEHQDLATDVRDFGKSARRILQDKSKVVAESVTAPLKDLEQEIGSIAPVELSSEGSQSEIPGAGEDLGSAEVDTASEPTDEAQAAEGR